MADPFLVADIGGTNARFAIAVEIGEKYAVRDAMVYRAMDFENVLDAATAYLDTVAAKPKRACFAAAGPVVDGKVDFTNSHWTLCGPEIARPLGIEQLRIVNDFFALAAGFAHLPGDSVLKVKDGSPMTDAPQLVIGPGTGLGQALIAPTSWGRKVIATEGGHVAFAPYTQDEIEIRNLISRDHPRVSVERLLSGGGLVRIHRALCAIEGAGCDFMQAHEITSAATTGGHMIAVKAVEMFCAILGRVAGDAVLATGARGGVVLGGGILPKMKEVFLNSDFLRCFKDKGRMSDYVGAVPVQLIITENAALFGAAASMETDN
ncbi:MULTISPECIES: glucokinase [Hyphococcus]|uniref:glucokinase n=1 Tax=Hyphococcus TaxID=2038635 RepID=UPI0013FD3F63|nr:glucokinase [Marinicaulis flavus]